MEWVLESPQIHSTFGALGYVEGDVYRINEDCQKRLEEILEKLQAEDRTLRTFRRAVGFGQNITKDLVPILIHVKDQPKIIDLTIEILVNLTIPIECLLSVDALSENNVGRHTIFELNNLLVSGKEAFADSRATKTVLDYIKKIVDNEEKISPSQQENVNSCLILLRNILHVSENHNKARNATNHTGSLQNKILWNLFTQSIDKILLSLICSSHGNYWSVTIVQLIALIYKDQHVGNLQKLLNIWFESSLSDTSEDNESNTSPPDQAGGGDSSPTIMSDPTSDSSDNGGSGKSNDATEPDPSKSENKIVSPQQSSESYNDKYDFKKEEQAMSIDSAEISDKSQGQDSNQQVNNSNESANNVTMIEGSNNISTSRRALFKRESATPLSILTQCSSSKKEHISTNSELSDCGYVTQLENQESISTSSNEDDEQQKKPVHQKPHTNKQRHNPKKRIQTVTVQDKIDKRRKKLVKRSKTNLINMKGLLHHTATDEDITNVLKEFTVDFLLKGFGHLISYLHKQLILGVNIHIDTSHFFWMITYFLKFAAQLELDLEHLDKVLTFEIISYLTYQGVQLCEEIQILYLNKNNDLKPCLRRVHLVVTAIRGFIQTVDTYSKISHLTNEDKVFITKLQEKLCSSQELKCLMVLLIRNYKSDVYSKQYLQDLIVTNHILLLLLDNGNKNQENSSQHMLDHIRQFASMEIMHQYGLLLQDFNSNGEYVNDCVFTMMHHVAGDLNRITTLFQPSILRTFSMIWETDFEICDDWSDLVEYVINHFIKTPQPLALHPILISESLTSTPVTSKDEMPLVTFEDDGSWSRDEIDKLNWYYMQSVKKDNVIDNIITIYKNDGSEKTYQSILNKLYQQEVISREQFDKMKTGCPKKHRYFLSNKGRELDRIEELKRSLLTQNLSSALVWLQNILLEACYAKICFNNKTRDECLASQDNVLHVIEPTSYHSILVNQSIPAVPWSNEQANNSNNKDYMELLHLLGFHLPVDSGKIFVRIPNFWSIEVLLHVAFRLGPLNTNNMKFRLSDLNQSGQIKKEFIESIELTEDMAISTCSLSSTTKFIDENPYRVQRIKQINPSIQFTPLPSLGLLSADSSSIINCADMCSEKNVKREISDIEMKMETIMDIDTHLDNLSTSEDNSICETASVSSDLTRMYVSDEDEKQIFASFF